MSLFTTLVIVTGLSEVGNNVESKDATEIVREKVKPSGWFSLNGGTFPGRQRQAPVPHSSGSSSPSASLQLRARYLDSESPWSPPAGCDSL